ncbi:hypothetical protein HNY73_008749 [Argiope bruennichi]|uniref:Uncharacterized protein n=1 Tax=Argiope bruennichi TaxID=94029 RepID=A0A8T0F8D3_ARGBR|nr:hypothetical protein HNY73_008749 [Argiope bruennichi]
MERSFVERAPSPTEQELLLRVITPTKRTMPGAQTPRTGSYKNLSGKGEMSSSSDEENPMDLQQCQGDSSEEVTRTQEVKTVPRPISPASVEVTDEFIAEHSLEVTQAISLKENLGNWAQALAAATSEDQHTQVKKEIQQTNISIECDEVLLIENRLKKALVTAQSVDDLPSTCFELTDDTEAVLGVIDKLNSMFQQQLNSIAEKILDVSEYDFELFMDAFLSRCLIISDEPCYLSFLLICSLIVTTARPIFIDLQCFTYAMICCLCLRIVYEKCYKDLFDENEESESLDSYCRSINPFHVEEEDSNLLLSVQEQNQISLLLSKAINMDYDNLILTNSDMRILHETIDIINKTDFLLNPYEQADMCYVRNNTMDVENEMVSKISDERGDSSCRENKICCLCGGKCFRYLELYKSEMLQQELSVDNDRSNCNG